LLERESTLEGIRVVELSGDAGAAFCGQNLAAEGADVLRLIEPSRSNPIHHEGLPATPGFTAAEVGFERFTRREILEGTPDEKRARIAKHLEGADVFLTDFDTQELHALGAHWEGLRAGMPALIYARVSVFGSTGPRAGWRGGELEAQAFSGVAGQLGAAERAPITMPYRMGLMHGGLHAAAAVTAALYARHKGSEGCFIDISAAQALAADVRNYSLMMRYYDLPLKRSGRRPQGSLGRYPTAIFPCKDGYVVLTARSGEQYRNFLAMMGNPAWATEPKFQDAYAMAMEHADEADSHVVPWLKNYTRKELVELGLQHRFPVGPLSTLDEVLEDEQYDFRGFFGITEAAGSTFTLPGRPAQIVRAEDAA
jgi:crotonobetainyl-CoA:carnitine CoA-transferase CaiB-like acyl-CoA transferase